MTKRTDKDQPFFTKKPYSVNIYEPKVKQPIWFMAEDMVPRFGFKEESGKYISGFSRYVPLYWWPSEGININVMFPNLNKY